MHVGEVADENVDEGSCTEEEASITVVKGNKADSELELIQQFRKCLKIVW
jgi:hypothetical protein